MKEEVEDKPADIKIDPKSPEGIKILQKISKGQRVLQCTNCKRLVKYRWAEKILAHDCPRTFTEDLTYYDKDLYTKLDSGSLIRKDKHEVS